MAKEWMQEADEEMERKGTKNTLREALGVKKGEDIPCKKCNGTGEIENELD